MSATSRVDGAAPVSRYAMAMKSWWYADIVCGDGLRIWRSPRHWQNHFREQIRIDGPWVRVCGRRRSAVGVGGGSIARCVMVARKAARAWMRARAIAPTDAELVLLREARTVLQAVVRGEKTATAVQRFLDAV